MDPREGPTLRLRPTNIDSTSGRLGEHPSWIVDLFRGDGIWHHFGAGWKAFPTRTGRAKMIDRLIMRRFAEVEFDVLLADMRIDNPMCSVLDDDMSRLELTGLVPRTVQAPGRGFLLIQYGEVSGWLNRSRHGRLSLLLPESNPAVSWEPSDAVATDL
jgi:hypothetical protein